MVVVVVVVLSRGRNVPRGAAATAAATAAVETAFRDRGECRAGAGGRAAGHSGHVWEGRGRVATGGGSVAVCTEAALQGAHGHTAHRREGSFGVGCVQSSPRVYYCRGHTDLHIVRTGSLPRNSRIRRDRRRHQKFDWWPGHMEDRAGCPHSRGARLNHQRRLLGWLDHPVQCGCMDNFGAGTKGDGG